MHRANTLFYVVTGHNSVEVVKLSLNLTGLEVIELEAKNMLCVNIDFFLTNCN